MVPVVMKALGGAVVSAVVAELVELAINANAEAQVTAKKEFQDSIDKAKSMQQQRENQNRNRVMKELARQIDASNMSYADKKFCRDAMNKKVAVRSPKK